MKYTKYFTAQYFTTLQNTEVLLLLLLFVLKQTY